jgi:predicted KAP-like P-loop ATPase
MRGFREALAEQSSQQKLVIVVDELDRCRPDYALNLLEVIKHFFDVPNVHFVLGVNLKELSNSVRARYGANSNAEKYLQKFITVAMPLTNRHSKNTNFLTQLQYFDHISTQLRIRDDWKYEHLKAYLKSINYNVDLSLRDIEKIVTLSKVSPSPLNYDSASRNLYTGLIILQVVSPTTIQKARAERLSSEDVFSIFDFPRSGNPRDFFTDAYSVWRLVSWDYGEPKTSSEITDQERLFEGQQPKKVLQKLIANCLDVFRLME